MFSHALLLPSDHYFFMPQVTLTDDALDPDWLRVGSDIVGGSTPTTFNQAFSLEGTAALPQPESWTMLLAGLAGVSAFARRMRRDQRDKHAADPQRFAPA